MHLHTSKCSSIIWQFLQNNMTGPGLDKFYFEQCCTFAPVILLLPQAIWALARVGVVHGLLVAKDFNAAF